MVGTNSKRVLLVEDSEDDAKLALRTLDKSKAISDVILLRDGQEALEWFFGADGEAIRSPAELPALVLLDLHMPRVGGADVLVRLRANEATRCIPVIVLTSSSEASDMRECYRLGANSYVRKPVEYSKFTQLLKQIEAYWLTFNEPPLATG